MRLATLTLLVLLFSLPLPQPRLSSQEEHSRWIESVLKETETIQVGMSRSDLKRVFAEEGGISTPHKRTYAFRECPYIKIDVEFERLPSSGASPVENPDDKIARLSKPYLDRPAFD